MKRIKYLCDVTELVQIFIFHISCRTNHLTKPCQNNKNKARDRNDVVHIYVPNCVQCS